MLRDSLTGLPHRFAFCEKVDQVLADPAFREGGWAVLAVDMTRFSRVNECMGALAGDELLITFARRLVSALRPTDMLARISGDEFGVLLKLDRGLADALRAADRIKAVLTLPFRLSDLEIRVDCAIGVALLTPGVTGADEVLRNAQFALKRAKKQGTTQVYEPILAAAARRRFSIETELRCALEAEALTLAYQPLVELETGRVAGFEALARWSHDGEVIPPGEFIPVAEESGLIVQLGRWALETATRTLGEWDRRTGTLLPFNISVNLSPIQISRDDIAAAVAGALTSAGISGDRLTLELTEGAIIHDPDRVAKALNALKKFRVRIAMDDFGTGFTSLSSLQKLPIDLLKIDQSFVGQMLADGDSTAIVRAMRPEGDRKLAVQKEREGGERGRKRDLRIAVLFLALAGILAALPGPAREAIARGIRGTVLRPVLQLQQGSVERHARFDDPARLRAERDSLAAYLVGQAAQPGLDRRSVDGLGLRRGAALGQFGGHVSQQADGGGAHQSRLRRGTDGVHRLLEHRLRRGYGLLGADGRRRQHRPTPCEH